MQDLIENIFKDNSFFADVKKRFDHKNQNAFLIVGDTNTGKTKFGLMIYFFVAFGLLKRKKLSMKDDLFCYSIGDLIKNLTKTEKMNVFYDEAGKDLDIGSWNSIFNRSLSHILQTQRIKENFYYFVLPHKRHITQTHLVNFNYFIVVRNRFVEGKLIRSADCYKIVTNHFRGNDYRGFSEDFASYVSYLFLGSFKIPDYEKDERFAPLKKFIKEYEVFEKKRKNDIAREIEEEYIMLEEQKQLKKDRLEASKMKVQMELKKYMPKTNLLDY